MSLDLPIYRIDAFASRPFQGNPAAVLPLDAWLPDEIMQAIAAETNLPMTAFFVREAEGWRIRWFTARVEMPLCGHATLASAKVVFDHLDPGLEEITFASRSGPLTVRRDGKRLALDFPAQGAEPSDAPSLLLQAVSGAPVETLLAGDRYVLLYRTAAEVRALAPDFGAMVRASSLGVTATAPGTGEDGDVDFVSRYFVPSKGIDEDPVTGSSHCILVPFWAARLGRAELRARQVSARGGELWCRAAGDRVEMSGHGVEVMRGRLSS